MGIKSIIDASCACLAVISINVNAALVMPTEDDWKVAGDGLITYDANTGLEWLDLTATTNQSYNDISAKLGMGEEFEGWRYATRGEVSAFFDAFGGDNLYYNTGWSTQNNGVFDRVSQKWGDLYCNFNPCQPGDGYSFFVTAEIFSTDHHAFSFVSDLATQPQALTEDWIDINAGESWDYEASLVAGSALVRETIIPLPAAVWLFGSGLLGLIGLARHKARSQY